MPEIFNLTKLATGRPPKALFYGPPGCGKTAWAATLGKHALFLDVDDGMTTALTFKDKFHADRQGCDLIQFQEMNPNIAKAFDELKRFLLKVSIECKAGKFPYKVIILDSLSKTAEYCARSCAKAADAKLTLPEWGVYIQEMKNIMVILKSLPISIILIAHEHIVEAGDRQKIEISVNGKRLPSDIIGSFDEVFYFSARGSGDNVKYVVHTKPEGIAIARTRFQIPNKMDITDGKLSLKSIYKDLGYDLDKESANA